MKVDIEDIKTYQKALRKGEKICYICGEIEPECGFVQMLQVNLDPFEISRDLCKSCYRKLWDEAQSTGERPEDLWNLQK
jgi:hypothetical protein